MNKLLALCLVWLSLMSASWAETAVGSNVESRVVVGFKVSDGAVASMVPEGWAPLTLPQGPLAGTNLVVLFSDRHLGLDPEGKPIDPPSSRYAALVVYGVNPEVKGARMFVARVFEQPPVVDVYGNATAARVSRAASLTGEGDGPRTRSETWSIEVEGQGAIRLDLSYEEGTPGWSSGEAQPWSLANPDFHRIYRYDQLADLAMSSALGRDLKGDVAFASDIPALADLFDGTERMTAITVIPVYVRKVFLP